MSHPGERRFIRAANSSFPMLWRRGLSAEPVTEPGQLMQEAAEKTGLDDFGDETFIEALTVLCRAQDEEAGLTPFGRVVAHGSLLRALSQRLTALEWVRRHPEILDYPIERPVIVLGGMRSGTTRLQRLLAADPRFQCTRAFEATTPAPPLSYRPGRRDPRRMTQRGWQLAADLINPNFRKIHPTRINEADEELAMLELSICGAQIEAQRPVPSFRDWSERTPQTHAYRFLKMLLQLQGWLRGTGPARPWVLKTPQYCQDLEALLEVFPDARLVAIQRDPVKMTASAASLAWQVMATVSETVTKPWCGEEWLHKGAYRARVTADVRAARPDVPAIDLVYRDMNADPIGVMRRVYDFLDLPLTEDVRLAMRRYLKRAARARDHGRHRYSLHEFGLTEAEVSRRFAAPSASA